MHGHPLREDGDTGGVVFLADGKAGAERLCLSFAGNDHEGPAQRVGGRFDPHLAAFGKLARNQVDADVLITQQGVTGAGQEDQADEFSAGDELGIDFQEKAFYDILKELCVKYDFKYPDDKMIELAKAVKLMVDKETRFPDAFKRDDIKSALKVELILLLDEFGYPPVERDEVYVEIYEQAENFKKTY